MSSQVNLISTIRFFEFGKPAPKGSRFKGTMRTESLVGWARYTENELKKSILNDGEVLEYTASGFFNYTSQRIGSTKTYTNEGWIKDEIHAQEFKEKIAEAFNKEKDLCWDTVLSLPSFSFAKNHSLEIAEDYAAVVQKVLPEFFEKVGLSKSNMIFWMDYHINTSHPHIHLTFLEKTKTRTKGMFTKNEIKMFKGMIYDKIMGKQKYMDAFFKNSKIAFKEKDELFCLLKDEMRIKIEKESQKETMQLMKELFQLLPKNSRLQYNAKAMDKYRPLINQVIDQLLKNPEIENRFSEFMEKAKTFDKVKSDALHERYDDIECNEKNRLYSQIGNLILKQYKENLDNAKHAATMLPSDILEPLSNKKVKIVSEKNEHQKENIEKTYSEMNKEVKNISDNVKQKMGKDFMREYPQYFNHYPKKHMQQHYGKAIGAIRKMMNEEEKKLEKSIDKYLEGDKEILL